MGRADHPWSAAVERGRSTLPKMQLGQHAVLTLPLAGGCDVIASLPDSATGHPGLVSPYTPYSILNTLPSPLLLRPQAGLHFCT